MQEVNNGVHAQAKSPGIERAMNVHAALSAVVDLYGKACEDLSVEVSALRAQCSTLARDGNAQILEYRKRVDELQGLLAEAAKNLEEDSVDQVTIGSGEAQVSGSLTSKNQVRITIAPELARQMMGLPALHGWAVHDLLQHLLDDEPTEIEDP